MCNTDTTIADLYCAIKCILKVFISCLLFFSDYILGLCTFSFTHNVLNIKSNPVVWSYQPPPPGGGDISVNMFID